LTAEKCGEILVSLKIGRVKFALIKLPCAISNARVKFDRVPFVKTLCAAGILLICGRFGKSAR